MQWFAPARNTKTANSDDNVMCSGCDEYVAKSEIHEDGPPLCSSCQKKHELEASSDAHWKTAGATRKCSGCDDYVDSDEIDATGRCDTCQKQDELGN